MNEFENLHLKKVNKEDITGDKKVYPPLRYQTGGGDGITIKCF